MIKQFFRVISFMTGFAILFIQIQSILVPIWRFAPDTLNGEGDTDRYMTFYSLPRNSLDYLTLGASHSYYSLNPMQIYAKYGISGYNLGGSGQSLALSYYWLKEAVKYQQPQIVLLDVSSFIYMENSMNSANIFKGLCYMRPSADKVEAAFLLTESAEEAFQVIVPFLRFHTNWDNLEANNFDKSSPDYYPMGAYIRFNKNLYTNKSEIEERFYKQYLLTDQCQIRMKEDAPSITPTTQNAFEQILSLCSDHNIRLLPVKFPTMNWNEERSDIVEEFLSLYNLSLIDMTAMDSLEINYENDTADTGYHVNYWGMTKISDYIADFLNSMNLFTDHRVDPAYSEWNSRLEQYASWEQDQLVGDTKLAWQFLHSLNKIKEDNYIIFSVKDEASANWKNEFQNEMNLLGLKSEFHENGQNSYIAVIDGGEVLFEKWEEAPMSLDLTMELSSGERQKLLVKSGGFTYGNISNIQINGVEHSMNFRGLNVVAVDKSTGRVIVSASIDSHAVNSEFSIHTDYKNYLQLYDEPIIENGIYRIGAFENPDNLMDVLDGSTEAGLDIAMRTRNGGIPQDFELTYVGDGIYTIRALCSDLYIAANNGGTSIGTAVIQEYNTNLSAQKWFIRQNTNSSYSLISLYNGLALNMDVENVEGETSLWLDVRNDTPAQQFIFEKAEIMDVR